MKRLANKPFTLLGINSDKDRNELRKTVIEDQITWRSWWDDGSVNGPIQTKWQVTVRPTIYIVDADGVIRYKNVEEDDFDGALDALLEKLAGDSAE